MSESTTTKLNAESHLLLDQPLLRLPHELLRKNFKASQRHVEREREAVLASLRTTANSALTDEATPPQTLASLDNMITRMQGLKRKLESLHGEEKCIHEQSRKRIQHLQDLYEIPSLVDVKYDEWSRVRLNRLLVDYLLRNGYSASARELAKGRGIEDLVDIEVFAQCNRIQDSLRKGSTQECLAWCQENKQSLRKNNVKSHVELVATKITNIPAKSNLEFELRLQQYIELVRTRQPQKLYEATQHAKKFLAPHKDTQFGEISKAAGLLAYPSNTSAEPYRTLYSHARWEHLARTFVQTHHNLLSLPSRPLLHIALSAGLSALKTPSCHSSYASSSSNANSSTTSVCPICSTELNELARNVPYAHHTKSYVENDPVLLPNGRIYGRERLLQMSAKVGMPDSKVKDPTTGEEFDRSEVKKVFIS
ncbi:GID complex subunit containing RING finger motif [Trichoglossum hirsutum]|uniref:GID complex subunit containing RING finger motif n=1 Tax=Trichoglossum hirsutum TaxID=265104 RepID=A0A9P8RTS8_9PEZI|nr:GID complex subunit containing RING finger motif [Trichoglossum hirsutum]